MITIKFQTNLPFDKKLKKASEKAEHLVAEQIRKDTSQFVPALTGMLDKRTRVKKSAVIYPGPYAKFLYYGKVMVDPNTGSTFAPKYGKKVLTDRNLVFTKQMHPQAQDHWFEASKNQNLNRWIDVARKAVNHGFK